jgi:hypothetical protein
MTWMLAVLQSVEPLENWVAALDERGGVWIGKLFTTQPMYGVQLRITP